MEATRGGEGAGEVMAVDAPSSGVVAVEKEMIDALRQDAALIHMLPVEMLLMVFAWVDTETLLRAVHAVCRSWRMAMSGMYVVCSPLTPLTPMHCTLTAPLHTILSTNRT
jgi:hypothetical protein